MTLKELLYQTVFPAIKEGRKERIIIGEGSQGEVFDRFICATHRDICFKVLYPGAGDIQAEYGVQSFLYEKGLDVPKPIELFVEEKAMAMEKIHGWNLEQIIRLGLKINMDVYKSMLASLEQVCKYVVHGDLSNRNVMFGDVTIDGGVIVDATTYVIDFGCSTIKTNPSSSTEYSNVTVAMRKILHKEA